jgi:hypothetical protein
MGVEEWITTSDLGSFSVDAVDYVNNITTSGTYFVHNGSQVTTTFSGITNGYRMFYDPFDITSSGVIVLTAHIQNDILEIEEQDFYLLYGYNLIFEETSDWGPVTQVDIRAQATNSVLCPNTVAEGFYFTTVDLVSRNLTASIQTIEPVNLGADIYPQSTAFFYGKTYTVTISGVKDWYNNVMEPYTYSFTIEDPPN